MMPPRESATTIRQIVSSIEVIPPRVKSCVKSPPTLENSAGSRTDANSVPAPAAAALTASGVAAAAKALSCDGS